MTLRTSSSSSIVLHAVYIGGAATVCGDRPARGLVLRTSPQTTFFLARPDRCSRCATQVQAPRAAVKTAKVSKGKPAQVVNTNGKKQKHKPKPKWLRTMSLWPTDAEIELARAALVDSAWEEKAAVKLLAAVGMAVNRAEAGVAHAVRLRAGGR